MLKTWIQETVPESHSGIKIIIISFYETIDECQKLDMLFQALPREILSSEIIFAPPVQTGSHKKLTEFCEISRTPAIIFWYNKIDEEVGRLYHVSSAEHLQTALESIKILLNQS